MFGPPFLFSPVHLVVAIVHIPMSRPARDGAGFATAEYMNDDAQQDVLARQAAKGQAGAFEGFDDSGDDFDGGDYEDPAEPDDDSGARAHTRAHTSPLESDRNLASCPHTPTP